MKQLTTYNRAAGYLNRIFDLLNEAYFENTLSRPTITIQSTPKAYGHFSLRDDTWVSTIGATHEINIGAGTLYALLSRFESEGLIRATKEEEKRKYYQLTEEGRKILEEEFDRLRRQVADGNYVLLRKGDKG